jgi:hypothetical protein
MRLYLRGRGGLPYWPHLRKESRGKVESFAYLNRLTLAQWREIFESEMPGAKFTEWRLDEGAAKALADIRSRGELGEYSDEDLLTDRLVVVWEKKF